ncbi:hypothetical protein SK803_14595 [Lentzea sp. BCCO 10_0856]|uniref:Uncharacterized protein n=1 Tax=Lentzea miocenica TaxID=3095431 RepID=A0ABU4SZX0_9PSEU|nr:hypothetical protein [Lentzea sp. BCCO 10_0856]MDX8031451.1 hypothetical protein [Lentzea sp. BCCO 10_0856]
MNDAPIVIPLSDEAAVVIEQDRVLFTRLVNGARMATDVIGVPLAGVMKVEPGVLLKPVKYRTPEHSSSHPLTFELPAGPAVWIRAAYDILIPTADPRGLAAEIERRRHRVARYGGVASSLVWEINPRLRVAGPDGYEPGVLPGAPLEPAIGKWHSSAAAPIGPLSPGWPAGEPTVPAALPYPESLPVVSETLSNGVRFSVSVRRTFLGFEPVSPGVVVDTAPTSSLSEPLAAWHVVRAGTVRGAHRPVRWCAADGRTEIRTELVDGPALWLWGPVQEWLVCTPRAVELADEVRLRQGVGMRFPLSSDLGAERRTWRNLSSTRPVDTPAGRALPPVPEWAPTAPTLIPQGCWEQCATSPAP